MWTIEASHTQNNIHLLICSGFVSLLPGKMALTTKREHSKFIQNSLGSVRVKMDGIKAEIKEADRRKKRAEEATREQMRREQKALDCKRELYEKIQQRETATEKAEMKLGYLKERRYLAEWRTNENTSMRRYLEKDQIDLISEEDKVVHYTERAQEMVAKIATKNKLIIAKEKDIERAEQREYKARDKAALLNEKVIAAEHESRRVTINYTPKTVAQIEKEILFLKQERDDCVDRLQRRQRKAGELEKRATELMQAVETVRNRTRQLEQTLHELRGAKV